MNTKHLENSRSRAKFKKNNSLLILSKKQKSLTDIKIKLENKKKEINFEICENQTGGCYENMFHMSIEHYRKHHQCCYIRVKKPQRAYVGMSPEYMMLREENEKNRNQKKYQSEII